MDNNFNWQGLIVEREETKIHQVHHLNCYRKKNPKKMLLMLACMTKKKIFQII